MSDDGWPSEKSPESTIVARRTLSRSESVQYHPPSITYAPEEVEVWYDKYLDRMDDLYDAAVALVKSPRFRRAAATFACLLLLTLFLTIKIVLPWYREQKAAWDAFNTYSSNNAEGLYGSNSRPHLKGLIQTQQLDSALLPGGPEATKSRRLIFIGDIHGCKHELKELLKKVGYDRKNDHIVAVGDIVNKGPDSLGVIDLLMQEKASVVRGNHDDRVILLAEQHHQHSRTADTPDEIDITKKKHHKPSHKSIARSLSKKQLAYMQSFPLILRIGPIRKIGEILVVHGGLVPGVPLEAQDPNSVMNMRTIDLETHVPSSGHYDKKKGNAPWSKVWNKYQRLMRWKESPQWPDELGSKHLTVVYGHDAKKGLKISKYTKGLDSNCVRGNQLSALVVSEDGRQDVVQIQCRIDYVASDGGE